MREVPMSARRHQLRIRFRRLPIGVLATITTACAFAGTAHAGLLTRSATNCPVESLGQPFMPWGDASQYTLMPGGSFEAGTPSWSLSGGAAVTSGNESFFVNSPSDTTSLSLPDGSSATSQPVCVGINDPTLRLFAQNTGSPLSALAVSVTFQTVLGIQATVPVSVITAGSSWEPTLPLPVVMNLLALGGQTPITFNFTPVGPGGNWHIDDAYLDPYQRGG
ncbi:MAG TPA: hypothetical protein VG223_06870 [Solirubrobacteraceae bacterium]|nr:hypothetical protein [Solirubrobacteraceae bacterium]